VEDLTKHKMDSEYYEIPEDTVEVVNKVIDSKGSVFVVAPAPAAPWNRV